MDMILAMAGDLQLFQALKGPLTEPILPPLHTHAGLQGN